MLVFLDVSKAFDKVYHTGLLHKLESFGISGCLLAWFKSYLSKRFQRVVLNGKHSDWKETNAGVPQGSILGPLLFLIFINDIVDDLNSEPFLYADDTSLMKPLKSNTCIADVVDINKDIQNISDWADQWRVTFNAAKTEYMIISKKTIRPQPLQIYFNDTQINQVRNHCHLGIWFSDTMSWEKHISETIKKTTIPVNLLKRMSRQVDRQTKLCIYTSYIRPLLEYNASIFSGNLSNDQIHTLEQVQRQALLSAVAAYRHTPQEKLLHEVGIEPLFIRRKYFGLCHLYKILNGLTPTYLANLLPVTVGNSSRYPLRNSFDLAIPRTTKNYVQRSFFWNTVNQWNTLDINIRQSPSLASFKRNVKANSPYKQNKLYDVFTPNASVHHSRMRMGLSALNSHRKKFNFIEHNKCPLCACKPEDPTHFFLKCPYLAIHRTGLLGVVSALTHQKIPGLNVVPITKRDYKILNDIVLYGSLDLSYEENVKLFKAVHEFICDSKRFNKN